MRLFVREEAGTALGLIERVHAGGGALAAEYPLVFHAGSGGRVVVAEEDGEPASVCAILVRELVFPDDAGRARRLRVGLIGSVTTDEAARGRGLASVVLERAEDELRRSGCALAMLWADSADFYAKRGYVEVGAERDVALTQELVAVLPDIDAVAPALPRDHAGMHGLYLEHESRVERSAEESAALFATPGMFTLVARDVDERPRAYVCCGRGHDLDGVVHEWAGEPEQVLGCLRWLLRAQEDATSSPFLMSPAAGEEVTQRLVGLGARHAAGVLGMAKLLDREVAAQALAEASTAPLGLRALPEGELEVSGPRGSARLDDAALLSLILPPRLERGALEALEARLGTRLEGLPWAPFLWGLDSI